MKLVFLGDIHGNRAALDAVLEDVRRKPVDGIFHVGDVVGYGAQPREVIARLQAEGIEGVRGNHDERVLSGVPLPVGQAGADLAAAGEAVCDWTRRVLSAEDRVWLERQPFMRTIDTGRMKVALFHATPVDMTTPPHARQGDDFFREMAFQTGAHVHVFGHTHAPFTRVVDRCWFVNAGSLNLSCDGDPRAAYAVVELNGGAAVRIVRVPFDPGPEQAAARAAGLPSGLQGMTRAS